MVDSTTNESIPGKLLGQQVLEEYSFGKENHPPLASSSTFSFTVMDSNQVSTEVEIPAEYLSVIDYQCLSLLLSFQTDKKGVNNENGDANVGIFQGFSTSLSVKDDPATLISKTLSGCLG